LIVDREENESYRREGFLLKKICQGDFLDIEIRPYRLGHCKFEEKE